MSIYVKKVTRARNYFATTAKATITSRYTSCAQQRHRPTSNSNKKPRHPFSTTNKEDDWEANLKESTALNCFRCDHKATTILSCQEHLTSTHAQGTTEDRDERTAYLRTNNEGSQGIDVTANQQEKGIRETQEETQRRREQSLQGSDGKTQRNCHGAGGDRQDRQMLVFHVIFTINTIAIQTSAAATEVDTQHIGKNEQQRIKHRRLHRNITNPYDGRKNIEVYANAANPNSNPNVSSYGGH